MLEELWGWEEARKRSSRAQGDVEEEKEWRLDVL